MYTVLVVDDNPTHIEILCVMLSKIDVECVAAYSGLEGIEMATQILPDLIIIDWIMPSETMTGLDATRYLVANNSTHHIPIIACSGAGNLCEAIHAGCVDYINKPFNLDTLLSKVGQYLN